MVRKINNILLVLGPKCIRNLEAHLRQAEGRRPKAWERERSEQHSTRSVFISEWTLAGGPYVYSTQSTLARSIFINTRGQLSLREIQKSWGKFQKKSRKSPEKVQKKSIKSPEKVQRKIRIIQECVQKSLEKMQRKFRKSFQKISSWKRASSIAFILKERSMIT